MAQIMDAADMGGPLPASAAGTVPAAPAPQGAVEPLSQPKVEQGDIEMLRMEDLACPVCFETLTDPFVTACGHSFCYSCLFRHLESAKNCPSCSHYLSTDLVFPNFLLSKIVKRARSRSQGGVAPPLHLLQQAIADRGSALAEHELDSLLRQLWELKQGLQERRREASMQLLLHFLQSSRQDKAQRLAQLQKELMCLEGDIQRVEAVGSMGNGHAGAPSAAALSHQARPTTPAGRPGSAAGNAEMAAAAAAAVAAAIASATVPSAPPAEAMHGMEQGAVHGHSVQHFAVQRAQQQQPQPTGMLTAAGMPGLVAALPAAAASALAAPAHHPHLAQPQQAAQQAGQQAAALPAQQSAAPPLPPQPQVVDFASAAFASLTAQALGPAAAANNNASIPGTLGHAPPAAAPAPGVHLVAGLLRPPSPADAVGGLLTPGPATTTTSTSSGGRPRDVLSLLRNKKRRIATQFEDLQQCYLQLRAKKLQDAAAAAAAAGQAAGEIAAGGGGGGQKAAQAPAAAAAGEGTSVGPVIDEGLHEFSRLLSVITRCNKLRLVAEVPRPASRHSGSSSIISSLEFDREGALFATAGVSKRISIFEFAGVAPHHSVVTAPPLPGGAAAVRSGAAPVVELLSRSKLSCLSWNKYVQAQIASSDYEGVVAVWDVGAATLLTEYEAHSKRIWSVDFCAADPTLLASGSDDCSVKFWSTKSPSSVAQVDTGANVCTVRWRPGSSHELAVGSADHSVYLYDLRNTAAPVCTFQGHRKAVSYVRFCNAGELVSASTDSTLRLWPVPDWDGAAVPADGPTPASHAHTSRVFEGHCNEKNFVGLAVDGDFLACGSETSELFVYYKSLSKPVAQQAFSAHSDDGGEAQSDKGFISAVCWRPGAQTLLAANSQGTVKVFSLTGSNGHA